MLIHLPRQKHDSEILQVFYMPISLRILFVVALSVRAIRHSSSTTTTSPLVEGELQFRATVLSVGQGGADAGDIARCRTRVIKVLEVGLFRGVFAEFGQAGSLKGRGQQWLPVEFA